MVEKEFYIHSRVYTDTFRNKPYSMSMREDIAVTTPDVKEHSSDYIAESMKRHRARVERERAEIIQNGKGF